MNKHSIEFVKFMDVESPIGINQGKDAENPFASVGIDVHMPTFTKTFVDAVLALNKHLTFDEMTQYFHKADGTVVMSYDEGEYTITDNICIPLGIGILIPEGYHFNLRTKSSNFKNKFTSVEGCIDVDYTYGMGVQVIPLYEIVTLSVNEKISQLEMVKSEYVMEMNEISLNKWETMEDVQQRRLSRKGGFGHTGKFK